MRHRSLSRKLAVALTLAFGLVFALAMFAVERMLDAHRALELGVEALAASIVFLLLAAVLLYLLVTRRLRVLAEAIDAFLASNFTRPPRNVPGDPRGDEIDRIGAALVDMSERISNQLKLLEENRRQRGELLANVSHDLRTPLASIQGYIETLLLKHGTLSQEEERSYLEVAARNSARLTRLVTDLFQLTKLESHELKPTPEAFALGELAQDVLQKFELSAKRRGLRLESRIAPDLPQVDADIGMIERVLENLIENAMRYTPAGGTVRLHVRHDEQHMRVDIEDTGEGISSQDLPNVFERYYRADRSEEGNIGHAGLGLAISRRMVELHGGRMTVESTVDVGTRFSFDLPIARPDPVSSPHRAPA
ncbi:MAG: HAMP domain-containing histidine kinase [Sterolibacteriaceae bacterium]|nr:HAMP domain-containing histidine kinase [Sterolibacteriaceae bacterium]